MPNSQVRSRGAAVVASDALDGCEKCFLGDVLGGADLVAYAVENKLVDGHRRGRPPTRRDRCFGGP